MVKLPAVSIGSSPARCTLAFALAVLWALPVHATPAAPEFSVVFDGKEGKYEVIRTPQLLVTQAGTFLAFAQGRSGSHDRSDNDIILKRSTDGGKTWSKLQTIADEGKDSLNSICMVQVRETGRILVIGCWFPDGYAMQDFKHLSPALQEYQRKAGREHEPVIKAGYEGRDIQRNYVIHSDDDGRTWTAKRDITRAVKLPAPEISCIPGPGNAIQLSNGPHAGRIIVPAYTRGLGRKPGESARLAYRCRPYTLWSDDRGATWQHGELAPDGPGMREAHGDETQMVELPGGGILMNTRAAGRNVAVSHDGGRTWSPLGEETSVKTYPTAAGFIRYSGAGDRAKSRILFSNPSGEKRIQGTISLSYDDGRTWPVQKTLRDGRFSYSHLARFPDGTIGCIFDGTAGKGEFAGHSGSAVLLARFSLEWLTGGYDRAP